MLKLLLGKDWKINRDEVLRRIGEDVRACRKGCILMVPELISHDMERRLCSAAGDTASRFAEVLSFPRLANRVFQTVGGLGREELDKGGRLLLMYRAVQSVVSQLSVYARPSRRPAFLSGLIATVDELKSCCVAPDRLLEVSQELEGSVGDKLRDLAKIYAVYTGRTQQIALDPRDRLDRAVQALKQGRCPWLEEADPQRMWIHPQDAEKRGLVTGSLAEIRNDRGRVRMPVLVTDRVIPGVVAIAQGAWYRPDADGTDTRGSINVLTSLSPTPLAKGNPQHTNLVEVTAVDA